MSNINRLFFAVLCCVSCQRPRPIDSATALRAIETGTDSTYDRQHFPNDNKSLYSVLTHYYSATVQTFVYYHDEEKKTPLEIKTYMVGKPYGHYFEFYEDGSLKQYYYNTGNGHTSYIRKYNRKGRMESEQGIPLVDYITDDKGNTALYFSGVFFDSLRVDVSSPGKPPAQLPLKNSPMQPLLSEGTLTGNGNTYFLRIVAISKDNRVEKTFADTLKIDRK